MVAPTHGLLQWTVLDFMVETVWNAGRANYVNEQDMSVVYAPKVGTCPKVMIFTVCFRS